MRKLLGLHYLLAHFVQCVIRIQKCEFFRGSTLKRIYVLLFLLALTSLGYISIFYPYLLFVPSNDSIYSYRKSSESPVWHKDFDRILDEEEINTRELCRLIQKSWYGEDSSESHQYDLEKNAYLDFEKFKTRIEAQTGLVGLKLFSRPIITEEYIGYYFGSDTPLISKSISIRDAFQEAYKSNEKSDDFLIKLGEQIRQQEDNLGLGKSESVYKAGIKQVHLYNQPNVFFRIDMPVSKKSFIEYPSIPRLHEPPSYMFDIFDLAVNKAKERDIKLVKLRSKNIKNENIDRIIQQQINSIEEKYNKYSMNFIKAERRVSFRYEFYRKINDQVPKNMFRVVYTGSGSYSENNKINDILIGVRCDKTELPDKKWSSKIVEPYLLSFPWKSIKNCETYYKWLQCHNFNVNLKDCISVSTQEPQMCSQ